MTIVNSMVSDINDIDKYIRMFIKRGYLETRTKIVRATVSYYSNMRRLHNEYYTEDSNKEMNRFINYRFEVLKLNKEILYDGRFWMLSDEFPTLRGGYGEAV